MPSFFLFRGKKGRQLQTWPRWAEEVLRPWFCFCAGKSAFVNLKRTVEREMHYSVLEEKKASSRAPSRRTVEGSPSDLGEESFVLCTFGGTYYAQSTV